MSDLRISDHAVLRFLERSGFDVEGLRDHIHASLARAHDAAASIGAGDYLITSNGMVFVVRANEEGHAVTTVLPQGKPGAMVRTLKVRK